MDKVRMKIIGISRVVSPAGVHVLVLGDEEDRYRIPVIIGEAEARALAMQLEHLQPRRPLTHDLIKNLMEKVGAVLVEVYIHRWEAGIYYSELQVIHPFGRVKLDARTSDAIALASHFDAPVYIAREVLERTAVAIRDGKIVYGEGSPSPRVLTDEELTRLMERAVAEEDYESATRYRDELKARKTNR
jgi:bifunctional DNase/RNase